VRFWIRTLKIRDLHEPHQLKEIATVVHDALQLLGHQARHQQQGWPTPDDLAGERQIIIGGNIGTELTLATIPDDSIVYNFEQAGNFHFSPSYVNLMRRCEVWDYNTTNMERMERLYNIRARLVPFGYVPSLTHEYTKSWDKIEHDVMFVGSMHHSSPRQQVISRLREAGVRVFVSESCYGEERARAYQQSRLVLNMHFHKEKVMESVRIGTAMANHKAVVCQVDNDTAKDGYLLPGMICTPYDKIVESCIYALRNDGVQWNYEHKGFDLFTKRKMDDILRPIINEPARKKNVPGSYERAGNPTGIVYRRVPRSGEIW
jgi:hypothetical protein